MSDIFQKIHGTTVDRFSIGNNNQTISLTGQTMSTAYTQLLDRNAQSFTVDSAVFFSAFIAGTGTNTAAYEIKGCYTLADDSIKGYAVTTYADTANIAEPVVSFSDGEINVSVAGAAGDTMTWSAIVNLVLV